MVLTQTFKWYTGGGKYDVKQGVGVASERTPCKALTCWTWHLWGLQCEKAAWLDSKCRSSTGPTDQSYSGVLHVCRCQELLLRSGAVGYLLGLEGLSSKLLVQVMVCIFLASFLFCLRLHGVISGGADTQVTSFVGCVWTSMGAETSLRPVVFDEAANFTPMCFISMLNKRTFSILFHRQIAIRWETFRGETVMISTTHMLADLDRNMQDMWQELKQQLVIQANSSSTL